MPVSLPSPSMSMPKLTCAGCAGGGTTRGAQQAGLDVKYGVDREPGETWRHNFQTSGADYYHMELFTWNYSSEAHDLTLKVDILHISPPCQPYSPANTRGGMNDESNTATLFAVGDCLKKALPRIVTIEETAGMLYMGRAQEYLIRLIQQITSLGFSVCWQLVVMADYGVPQNRKRLVIIAAWYDLAIHLHQIEFADL